jgi:hypothetical protein
VLSEDITIDGQVHVVDNVVEMEGDFALDFTISCSRVHLCNISGKRQREQLRRQLAVNQQQLQPLATAEAEQLTRTVKVGSKALGGH